MFEDLIANTSPEFTALPETDAVALNNLYMDHNSAIFNAKRNMI